MKVTCETLICTFVALAVVVSLSADSAWGQSSAPKDSSEKEAVEWFTTAGKLGAAGDAQQAALLYEKILTQAPSITPKGSEKRAIVLNNLGIQYRNLGHFAKAEALYRESLEIYEAKYGANHPLAINTVYNLAYVYRDLGDFAKSEELFSRSLAVRETKLGKDHPQTADSLNGLAVLYQKFGQFEKAEVMYRRSLAIFEAKLGNEDPATTHVLNNLANLYSEIGQDRLAEPLLRRSLEVREIRLGKNHPETATAIHNLATLYHDLQEYRAAESLFRRSLQIRETKLGEDHPDTAASCLGLANLFFRTGKHAEAEPLFRRSVRLLEGKVGKEHPHTTKAMNNLAWNWAAQKEWPKAIAQVQETRPAITKQLTQILPVMAEREQLDFLNANFVKSFHAALSLGWAARPHANTVSAEWLLNGKSLAYQSLAERHLLARDAAMPSAKNLVEDLQRTRTLLAVQMNRLPQAGMETRFQQETQALQSREQELAQKLARSVGRPYRSTSWIPLEELQAKLDAKSVFVDISRFDLYDFAANQWSSPRYVAWVTPSKGQVELIDLGDAAKIDELITHTRQTLVASAKSITSKGEKEAEAELLQPLKALSALVLQPLLPALQKYDEWIISPDGALWLIPWNALLLPDQKFVIEKHLIRHVVSGRDLVLTVPTAKAEGGYVFADPDFDLSPALARQAGGVSDMEASSVLHQRLTGAIGAWNVSFEFLPNEVLIRDEDNKGEIAGKGTWKQDGKALTIRTETSIFEGTMEADAIRGQRTRRNEDNSATKDTFRMALPRVVSTGLRSAALTPASLPRVARLPGTAAEAEAIRGKVHQWLGSEPRIFVEANANEAALRTVHAPRLLTIASHGYFLPRATASKQDKRTLHNVNPLLRCGLLLAGCNRRAEAKAGEDDGVVTGLEIVGLDLRGCELVVLSACETGLGDLTSGEGLAGLRQSFQLAGAKSVLASLWQVSDRETALLMNAFYGELAKGKSQSPALREAQLSRIAARKANFGAAHPFYWAAFTLTGGAE